MNKGFTLIELLIVVAIIAILAAIAIPNFLQAQIRAKISRVNNDLRTMATGLESYYIDHNAYPPHDSVYWLFFGHSAISRHQPLNYLTSPVSYLTSLSADPFAPTPMDPRYNEPYRYIVPTQPDPPESTNDADRIWIGTRPYIGEWMVWSQGPNLFSELAAELMRFRWGGSNADNFRDTFLDNIYDPTNGLSSYGDIYRSQLRSDGGPPPVPR